MRRLLLARHGQSVSNAVRRFQGVQDVPLSELGRRQAEALAGALGFPLISPRIEGLRTFDASHLDPESADRFAGAFLDEGVPGGASGFTGISITGACSLRSVSG